MSHEINFEELPERVILDLDGDDLHLLVGLLERVRAHAKLGGDYQMERDALYCAKSIRRDALPAAKPQPMPTSGGEPVLPEVIKALMGIGFSHLSLDPLSKDMLWALVGLVRAVAVEVHLTETGPELTERIIEDVKARTAEGVAKYGTPLCTHNGRSALIDLYQELLDALQYHTQVRMEARRQPEAP